MRTKASIPRTPAKFSATVSLGFERGELSPDGWARIRATTLRLIAGDRNRRTLGEVLPEADCILVGLGEKVNRGMLQQASRLRYIGVLGTGYEGIDTAAAAAKGIVVCNVPDYATEAVAEFTLAAILGEMRHAAPSLERARAGDLSGEGFEGDELRGKVLGVVGMGRIGRRVAEIALGGFKADVAYWSRSRKPEVERIGARFMHLDNLLKSSHVVTLHLPLNEGTSRLLDARRLGLIRPGAIVVNFSPMGLIEVRPMLRLLRSRAFTLILDHADELSPVVLQNLRALRNCRVYPPIGYRTAQARDARESTFVSNIDAFLRGRPKNQIKAES
jgi:lactate dehydrogenase-like 2-hydroxyacid dehydrogenase